MVKITREQNSNSQVFLRIFIFPANPLFSNRSSILVMFEFQKKKTHQSHFLPR